MNHSNQRNSFAFRLTMCLVGCALFTTVVSCTPKQPGVEQQLNAQISQQLANSIAEKQEKYDSHEARIAELERAVADLKTQLADRLPAATMPADSTTMPARPPAP